MFSSRYESLRWVILIGPRASRSSRMRRRSIMSAQGCARSN